MIQLPLEDDWCILQAALSRRRSGTDQSRTDDFPCRSHRLWRNRELPSNREIAILLPCNVTLSSQVMRLQRCTEQPRRLTNFLLPMELFSSAPLAITQLESSWPDRNRLMHAHPSYRIRCTPSCSGFLRQGGMANAGPTQPNLWHCPRTTAMMPRALNGARSRKLFQSYSLP